MRVNMAQKVVLAVAAGVVLVVVGFALRAWFWTSGPGGGWFNYAPNNGVMFSYDEPAKGPILGQAAAWVGLVVVWTLGALVLFRSPRTTPVDAAAEGPV